MATRPRAPQDGVLRRRVSRGVRARRRRRQERGARAASGGARGARRAEGTASRGDTVTVLRAARPAVARRARARHDGTKRPRNLRKCGARPDGSRADHKPHTLGPLGRRCACRGGRVRRRGGGRRGRGGFETAARRVSSARRSFVVRRDDRTNLLERFRNEDEGDASFVAAGFSRVSSGRKNQNSSVAVRRRRPRVRGAHVSAAAGGSRRSLSARKVRRRKRRSLPDEREPPREAVLRRDEPGAGAGARRSQHGLECARVLVREATPLR